MLRGWGGAFNKKKLLEGRMEKIINCKDII